jgi:LacI family transcriptional regulator
MKAVWEAGRRIGDDVAIVGAGDVAHGDLLRVPLTTVSWSKEDLGRKAAELLCMQIGEGNGRSHAGNTGPYQRVIIPPRLVIRQSCGSRNGS